MKQDLSSPIYATLARFAAQIAKLLNAPSVQADPNRETGIAEADLLRLFQRAQRQRAFSYCAFAKGDRLSLNG